MMKDLKTKLSDLESENAALRQSCFLFQSIFEKLPLGLQVFDKNGFSLRINDAQKKILGIQNLEEGIGRFNVLTDPFSISNGSSEIYKKVYDGGSYDHEFEYNLAAPENSWKTKKENVFLKESIFPIINENSEVSYVVALLGDITRVKEAEDQIRSSNEANEELVRSRENAKSKDAQFRLVVENAPVAIFIQTDGQFAYVNEAAVSLYGAKNHEELIGTEVLDRVQGEFRKIVKERIRGLNENLKKAERIEYVQLKMNGSKIDVEVSAVPFSFEGRNGALVFLNDISARKSAEHKLFERDRIMQLFVKYAPASIAMFDRDMRYLACSKRFLRDYNIKDENIIGKSHYDVFPEIGDNWKAVHQRCLRGNIESREDDMFPRADGRTDWVRWEIHPWWTNKNEPGGIILFSEVITDRKNAEIELYESRGKLARALETGKKAEIKLKQSYDLLTNLTTQVPGVVYQYRLYPNGHSAFPYSTTGMWNIYEVTPEEVREDASAVFTRLHPDDYDYIVEAITESARNQTLYESEFRVILPEQGLRWRYCSARPELLPDGSTLWYGIITDITARKEIEKELELKNLELNTFFTCNLDLLCIADMEGRLLRLNKEWENVLGYPLEEMENSSFLEYIHPEDLEPTPGTIKELTESPLVLSFTNRFRCKDGTYKWIEWKSFPSGKMIYASARDISERIKTLEELNDAKEKAEESDRLKTAFLQNMSHEIRTPMNAIVGFAGLLPNHFNNKPRLEYFTRIITQRCNDLLDIINDILDIAKIESGQLTLHMGTCEIEKLFIELQDFFTEQQAKMNKLHIRFELIVPAEYKGIKIITDAVKLKQILINLISNAFKFTDNGKIEGSFFVAGEKLVFYVSDTGLGIHPDKHKMIFERFSQVEHDGPKVYGGTGLGLSIVKGLVKLLGGEIWLESSPGSGSKFSFSIEYREFYQKNGPGKDKKDEPCKFSFSNRTVLIVEDDEYNSTLIGEILNDTGVKLLFTDCGNESINMALKVKPDMILMDIGLPDISGYEAAKRILAENPSVIIIAQTAYAGNEYRTKSIDAGCSDHISKPIIADDLLTILRKHLD